MIRNKQQFLLALATLFLFPYPIPGWVLHSNIRSKSTRLGTKPIRIEKIDVVEDQCPIEQLDVGTGKVVHTYPSVGAAAKAVSSFPCYILRSMRRGGSHRGFFWREVGSDASPAAETKPRFPVEKICLESRVVLETFPSAQEAARSMGRYPFPIPSVTRGFFWRRQGSQDRLEDYAKTNAKAVAVEQICLETHQVIATYPTVTAAATAVGTRPTNISKVLKGKGRS